MVAPLSNQIAIRQLNFAILDGNGSSLARAWPFRAKGDGCEVPDLFGMKPKQPATVLSGGSQVGHMKSILFSASPLKGD